MADISTDLVKSLRDQTGISVMQCKKALEEAGGDLEKAVMLLRKKGSSAALKKSDRTLGAGTAAAYVHGKSIAASVVLHSETDFVAKHEEFEVLARDIAMQIAATNPLYVRRDDIPAEKMEEIRSIFRAEVEGKPEDMKEKILSGKVDVYLKGIVLLEQPYIKDGDRTIQNLVEEAVQKFGERIEVGTFARLAV